MKPNEFVEKKVEAMKKEATKHEGCTLDDQFCYDHQEMMQEEDRPNSATAYNAALDELKPFLLACLAEGVREERHAWLDGARCLTCGIEKPSEPLSDTCVDCLENA